jgi:predicted nuclease of restriction endonuclease-like (RecB) superfamily
MQKNQPETYNKAVEVIKTAILQGQYEAAKGVNRIQLAVYFAIGKYISQHTRKGVWGTGALEIISQQLRKELPGLRGFSATSMKNMRKFYEGWIMLDANSPIAIGELQSIDNQEDTNSAIAIAETEEPNSTIAIAELGMDVGIDIYHTLQIPDIKDFPIEDFFRLPFSHHIRIIEGTKDLKDRYYYIHRAVEENIPSDKLAEYIKKNSGFSRESIPSNFVQTLPNSILARKAVMMFKDEYFLDFINVEQIGERESIDVDEREVEQQIIQNIKNFIMTFGNDFAFIGNQYHLEVYGVEHFPDLLFFNRELNALVVVELKTGDFKSSYLGQLMSYLSILDAKVKKPHENPSIGIVLCKEANREYVEFVIRDYNKPMGVATYKTTAEMPEELRRAMPDIEELKKLL